MLRPEPPLLRLDIDRPMERLPPDEREIALRADWEARDRLMLGDDERVDDRKDDADGRLLRIDGCDERICDDRDCDDREMDRGVDREASGVCERTADERDGRIDSTVFDARDERVGRLTSVAEARTLRDGGEVVCDLTFDCR